MRRRTGDFERGAFITIKPRSFDDRYIRGATQRLAFVDYGGRQRSGSPRCASGYRIVAFSYQSCSCASPSTPHHPHRHNPIFFDQYTMQDIRNPLSKNSRLVPSSIFANRLLPCPPPYFLRNEHPSVNLALPPVGWHRTVEQPPQMTTVWACEKTVVMLKQPGHLTSMKKERGAGTSICGGEVRLAWQLGHGWKMGRRRWHIC